MRRKPIELADDRAERQLPSDALDRLAEMQQQQSTGETETPRTTIAEMLELIKIWEAQIAASRQ